MITIIILICKSNFQHSDHSMTNSTLSLFCFRLYYVFYTLCSSAGATTYTTIELLLYNHIRRIEVQLATQWPILTIFVQKLSGLFSFQNRDIVLRQTQDFSWLKKCWIKAGELILKALKQSIVEVLKYFNAKWRGLNFQFNISWYLYVLLFQYGRLLNRVVKL